MKQEWRRLGLSGLMATLNEFHMLLWIAHLDAHCAVPTVGNRYEIGVDNRLEARNDIGQRVAEVFILSAPETMSSHYDAAAEDLVVGVQPG